MNRFASCFVLTLVAISSAAAQSVDLYVNASTDGYYLYGSSVLEYQPPSLCTGMCSTATHTYSETAEVISPSGASNSCSTGNFESPAGNPEYLEADCALDIDVASGTYTVEGVPYADCSVIGLFVNPNPIFIYIGYSYEVTSTIGWPDATGPTCPQTPACTNGTSSYCTISVVMAPSGAQCYAYYSTAWLVIAGGCYGFLGRGNQLSLAADGPGPCK